MATQKPSGLLDFRRSFPSVSTALPFVLLLAAMSFGCTTRSAMDRPVITGADGSSRTEQYRWRNVKVGGGGYVTGLVIHPKVPDQIYLRTDVGGIYKWDVSRNAWTALTDSFSREDWHLYGVESLALHPNDPQTLYAALGKYLPRQWLRQPSGLYKSEDGGRSWRALGLRVAMGGNENFRWAGERLAIDPNHPQTLMFGSRSEGLWRSSDGGEHFQRVDSFPTLGTPEIGLTFVLFDERSGMMERESQVIYVGVQGEGVFRSRDAGRVWERLHHGPFPKNPQRAVLASDGTVYVSGFGDKKTLGGIFKFGQERWQNITPKAAGRPWDYCGITVDPTDPQTILAAPASDNFPTPIFRSQDAGKSWHPLTIQRSAEVPWWPQRFFTGHTSALVIDPHHPKRVFLTDYYGVWQTDHIDQNPSQWSTRQKGHEEVEPFVLRSPPQGAPLLSGVADVDGFRHSDLDSYPEQRMIGKDGQDGDVTGLDFCESNPSVVIRVGKERGGPFRGAYSEDNGASFTRFATLPFATAHSGRVAVSATDCQHAIWVPEGASAYLTLNGGQTWQPSLGAPHDIISDRWNYTQPLASDRVSSVLFYLFLRGAFYGSTDGGRSFSQIASLPAPTFDPRSGLPGPSIKATPGVRGQVFVCLQDSGLFRSDDAGHSFSRVSGVDRCQLFALGRPMPASSVPTLFVYGLVDGIAGIFRSSDLGRSYLRIDSKSQPIGDQAMVMEGDPRVFGRVYIGTNGRGTFYGEPISP